MNRRTFIATVIAGFLVPLQRPGNPVMPYELPPGMTNGEVNAAWAQAFRNPNHNIVLLDRRIEQKPSAVCSYAALQLIVERSECTRARSYTDVAPGRYVNGYLCDYRLVLVMQRLGPSRDVFIYKRT